jgi:hypothetical protein
MGRFISEKQIKKKEKTKRLSRCFLQVRSPTSRKSKLDKEKDASKRKEILGSSRPGSESPNGLVQKEKQTDRYVQHGPVLISSPKNRRTIG